MRVVIRRVSRDTISELQNQVKTEMSDPKEKLMELDSRHNELLDRLSELDREIQEVLGEWTRAEGLAVAGMATQAAIPGNEPVSEPVMGL